MDEFSRDRGPGFGDLLHFEHTHPEIWDYLVPNSNVPLLAISKVFSCEIYWGQGLWYRLRVDNQLIFG